MGRPQAPLGTSDLSPLGDFSGPSALWWSAYTARKERTLAPDLMAPLGQGFIHSPQSSIHFTHIPAAEGSPPGTKTHTMAALATRTVSRKEDRAVHTCAGA